MSSLAMHYCRQCLRRLVIVNRRGCKRIWNECGLLWETESRLMWNVYGLMWSACNGSVTGGVFCWLKHMVFWQRWSWGIRDLKQPKWRCLEIFSRCPLSSPELLPGFPSLLSTSVHCYAKFWNTVNNSRFICCTSNMNLMWKYLDILYSWD